jgi:hypothetical protein
MSVLARSATEVCRAVPLSPEAKALLKPQQTVKQLLDELLAKQDAEHAGKLLAHALPKRAAVWWGCQCVRQVPAAAPTPESKAALAAAERWVSAQDEDSRRAAQAAAEKAGYDSPAGIVALAAYLSSGSLAPADLPEVPPAEGLTADAVAGAVNLAAVLTEPEKAPERLKKFFALGADVDSGKNRWPESAGKPAGTARPS